MTNLIQTCPKFQHLKGSFFLHVTTVIENENYANNNKYRGCYARLKSLPPPHTVQLVAASRYQQRVIELARRRS